MADLGLDMTDKDDVRTCILKAFLLLCISVGNTLYFIICCLCILNMFVFIFCLSRATMLKDLALWFERGRGKSPHHRCHVLAVRAPQDHRGTNQESEMPRSDSETACIHLQDKSYSWL